MKNSNRDELCSWISEEPWGWTSPSFSPPGQCSRRRKPGRLDSTNQRPWQSNYFSTKSSTKLTKWRQTEHWKISLWEHKTCLRRSLVFVDNGTHVMFTYVATDLRCVGNSIETSSWPWPSKQSIVFYLKFIFGKESGKLQKCESHVAKKFYQLSWKKIDSGITVLSLSVYYQLCSKKGRKRAL